MNEAEYIELFAKGAIIGQMIGDALGYPWQNSPRPSIPTELIMVPGPGDELPGDYTSLSAFMLATIDSLNEQSKIDPDDILDKFYEVYIGNYLTSDQNCYDVSSTTAQTIDNYSNGMPSDICGVASEQNDGDCLCRILPVVLFFATSSNELLLAQIDKICTITHKDIYSRVACAYYGLMLRNLFLQKQERVYDILSFYYDDGKFHQALKSFFGKNGNFEPDGSVDMFWLSWKSFLLYEQDFRFTVSDAIQQGGDSNLNGSLAGALSGISLGLNEIPVIWLRTIRLPTQVMEIIMRFSDHVVKTVTESNNVESQS